jgi:hypothetical protein
MRPGVFDDDIGNRGRQFFKEGTDPRLEISQLSNVDLKDKALIFKSITFD